ncbi:unnamed protein product, partial [Symbiodinium necroappetens]
DSFNQRMEFVISSTKEGKVIINSGFYTEATMKSELNFSKERIAAVVKYCTKTRARKKELTRKDKYQSHIREYWVDVSTVGSLSNTHREQFNHCIEILDPDCSLPVPLLESSPKPCYDADSDQEDADSSSDEECQDQTPSTSKAKQNKKKKTKKSKSNKSTPSPKTRSEKSRDVLRRAERKKRENKEEEIERALEAYWGGGG